jgi:hypothetical protein
MWQRPWAFWAFLLPVLVLLLARSPLRPHRVATGALSLWRRVEESAHAAGGERPKLPPALLCLVIGLFLGVLSLAGPRELSGGTSRTWQIVVDRSPSAYLSSAGSKLTRLDAALALLESRLSDELRSGDSLRWFDGSEWLGGSEVPSSWISAPRVALSAPRWEEQDLPGVIWVCPVEPGWPGPTRLGPRRFEARYRRCSSEDCDDERRGGALRGLRNTLGRGAGFALESLRRWRSGGLTCFCWVFR